MPPKGGSKKSAKSDEEVKKKDTTKGTKKGAEETTSSDPNSIGNDTSTKTAAINANRGTSQLAGGSSDEIITKEPGVSTSELSHYTDGNRDNGESGNHIGDSALGVTIPEIDIKYEEPVLPSLIILKFVKK